MVELEYIDHYVIISISYTSMKKKIDFPKLPDKISVDIKRGKSGRYLAYLPEFDIFTEANNPAHLFFQVNDLIYTFFDVPKKYQSEVFFIPPVEVREQLSQVNGIKLPEVKFQTVYSPLLIRGLQYM